MAKAIEFNSAGQPAKINYNVPLPGSHSGKRIMEIDLGLTSSDFTQLAKTIGKSVSETVGVEVGPNNRVDINETVTERFLTATKLALSDKIKSTAAHTSVHRAPPSEDNPSTVEILNSDYIKENLKKGVVMMPTVGWAGNITYTPRPVQPVVKPRIFIIEVYGISSFLGDYGMGRTVKTFTLLPGETTNISLRTWQTTKESRQASSSIIDSHEQTAKERFADKIQNVTTDKQTSSKTEEWHAEAEAKASWGFGSAKVSGGGSGEYSSSREHFAKQATESVKEHAAEASSKREMSVNSSSERETETGEESMIERTISNVNMRRVLNFVFRELNQEYITKLHLKDIRIGFSNGKLNSWREVSIAELKEFLEDFIVTAKREEVAQSILKLAGFVKDAKDEMVPTLQKVTLKNHGTKIEVKNALLDNNGKFQMADGNNYYRFKPGPLNQDNENHQVEGVVQSVSNITMRTDSVLVEALLGQADALDEFAMEIQKAAAQKETLSNDRETLIQKSIDALSPNEKKAKAIISLENGCAEDLENND